MLDADSSLNYKPYHNMYHHHGRHEIALLLEMEEAAENPTGISECLVNFDRAVLDWGFGHVDNQEAVSKLLVRESSQNAVHFSFPFPCNPNKDGPKLDMPRVVLFVGKTFNRALWERHPGAQFSLSRPSKTFVKSTCIIRLQPVFRLQTPGAEVDFDSGDLDWLPKLADSIDLRAGVEARSAVCPWGFDVSVGRLISEPENPATDARLAFTKVRSNFNLKDGQKVGIAVLFSEDSKPKASTIAGAFDFDLPVNEADIRRIYGRSGEVNIYTGKIKYVGVTYIVYDINSFTGCSGAVVFLLDEHQPEDSVQECDYGKAVAIHAGAHPSQGDRNYGFMLKHHPSLDY